MKRHHPLILVASAVAFLAAAHRAPAAEAPRSSSVVTFYLENDYFGGTDRHYTNGAKLSWISRDLSSWGQTGWRQSVLEALPFVNRPGAQKNVGLAVGQNMYTPERTELPVPDPADRPYAGWSYLELSFISKTPRRMDSLALQVGLVGPRSYAHQTQEVVHRWIDSEQAQGWDSQLHDELGVNVIFERRWRLFARAMNDTLGVDLVPHAGASLGNVQTYANLGLTARLGFHLPNNFGVEPIGGGSAPNSPLNDTGAPSAHSRRMSLFLFGGVDGRAVARDLFLDGNTWRDSPSVDKEPFVGDAYWGAGFVCGAWQITYTYVVRSREFERQREITQFGSVAVSRAF